MTEYTLTFGEALEAMKAGYKVARKGWNGKDMWIAITPGSEFKYIHAKEGHAAFHLAREIEESPEAVGDMIALNPHIDMRTADGSMCVGWLASQSDMLSSDWGVLS